MKSFFTLLLIVSFGLPTAFAETDSEIFIPVQGMTIGPDYIVFEAEATTSPLGHWQIVRPGDSRYKNSANYPPINKTHLEFTGNNPSVGSPSSPLNYTFKCPKTGSYRLGGRLFQRLEGQPNDKCNDVYIKMAGDFTSGNTVTTNQLKTNQKFFGRGVNRWGALYSIEVGEHQGPAVYKLKEGEIYTFTVSGRAQRTNVDYWLLYETSLPIKLQANNDLMAVNDEKYRPIVDVCKTFNAVDMTFTGITGFNDAQTDNKAGMSILQIPDRLAWAAAQMVFQGTTGEASFVLNTLQETDGESTYRLKVNGELIGEATNDRIYGTSIPDYTVQSHLLNTDKVILKNGDTIQVEFRNATNGLVPEGDLTATARGRWLSLDICTSGSFAQYYFTLSSDSIAVQLKDSAVLTVDKLLPYNVDQDIEWTSFNPDIATVDSVGKVKALRDGTTTILAKTRNAEYSASCKLFSYSSLPFSGTPIVIPGVIEAENFDSGGEGMAYYDLLSYNAGNIYRQTENVDIDVCSDGGYNLISTQKGEWLLYTVDVEESGIYAFHTSVASALDNRMFRVEMDEERIMETVTVNNTGGLTEFKTVIVEGVALTKGRHVLKLSFETDGLNMSWMGFFLPDTKFNVLEISISSNNFRLDADASKQLLASVFPVVALDKTITWSSDDINVARVDSTGMVTGVNQGRAYIKATSSDGAVSDSVRVSVFGYTGIEEVKLNYSLFPNPGNGAFTITLNENALATYVLHTLNGVEVLSGSFHSKIEIALNDYTSGIYLLEVRTDKARGVQRIILK